MTEATEIRRRARSEIAHALGARIRSKREIMGLTTGELGRAIEVTGNAIIQYESGRAAPETGAT
ncbi:hypothetical protein [Gluconacetobacter asukensis]|uniref:HTH cro/C1-type domain-containing protein n=1 Tax=Gluconacetobacter asukensis TaxID=1017181 RepID=A0A7W4P0L9_9PROT|nr:hypothetical protein [Gluconacetobacter asukensis]MBB2170818.1 hypothetical protein [Gluconacetobacter asukensis]